MADLRSKFIEDYAGGLLNISRQELASTGEVLSQDGLLSDASLFVEDGAGVKSGLKLGVALAEVVDPTTDEGAINVRYANRTYASLRDLKIFSTAVASAQASLADASSTSITNLENAFQLLEEAHDTLVNRFESRVEKINGDIERLSSIDTLTEQVDDVKANTQSLTNGLIALEGTVTENISRNTTAFNTVGNLSKVVFDSAGGAETLAPTTTTALDANRPAADYTVTGLASSTGTGLNVTITVDDTGASTIKSIDAAGVGFRTGQQINVLDSALGSGGGVTLVLNVTSVDDSGMTINEVKDEVKKVFTKVNEIIDIFAGI